jgi:hypothetical protein
MDRLEVDNQIILLEAVRRFWPQSENKELVLPMACQWYNEHSTHFLIASVFHDIVASLYEIPQGNSGTVSRPFSIG